MNIEKPLKDLYEHKDDIGKEKIYIIVERKTNKELAKFNVFEIPELPKELLERPFKGGAFNRVKNQSMLFV